MSKVGHTKGYIQVLVAAPDSLLGTSAMVKITSVGRWSVFGQVIEILNHNTASSKKTPHHDESSLCNNSSGTCTCSEKMESCACGNDICCSQSTLKENGVSKDTVLPQNHKRQSLIGWILQKQKHFREKKGESEVTSQSIEKQGTREIKREWDFVDKALLGGIFISLVPIIALITARVIGSW